MPTFARRRRLAALVAAAAIALAACTGGSDQDASDDDPPPTLSAADEPSTSGPALPSAPATPSPTGPVLPAESYLPSAKVGDTWTYTVTSVDEPGRTITDTETITAVQRDGAARTIAVQRTLRYDDRAQPDMLLGGEYVLGDDGSLTIRFSPDGPDPSPIGVVTGEIAIPAWAALQTAPSSGTVATGGFVSTTLTWTASSAGATQILTPSGAYTARVVVIELIGGDRGVVRALLYTADGVGPVRVEVQIGGTVVSVAQLTSYDPA